jgi:2-phospho-L-lactate/phosphoenolpyruvate guanylyltransferase
MWSVVIPVKGTSNSKTRFAPGDNSGLAVAMALDSVGAALAADGVDEVIVVTSAADAFRHTGAIVVADHHAGLNAAIEAGLAAVGVRHDAQPSGSAAAPSPAAASDLALGRNRAVLLGDVPALRPAELGAALKEALGHPLSMVADSDGTGTTLATATSGHRHVLAFGPGSREAHVAAGYTELSGDWPGLSRDVDSQSHLDVLAQMGMLGEHTSAYLQFNAPT